LGEIMSSFPMGRKKGGSDNGKQPTGKDVQYLLRGARAAVGA